MMAEHDVAVAHCPGSNGKLGSGVARLTEMLARGIRVGLGTDGPASNDDLHLWDEMRLAAILARATAADPAPSARPPPCGWPPGAAGRRWVCRSVPSRSAARPTSSGCAPTTPDSCLRSTTPSSSGTWSGRAGYLVTDVWVGGADVVTGGRTVHIDGERARDQVGERAHRLFAP